MTKIEMCRDASAFSVHSVLSSAPWAYRAQELQVTSAINPQDSLIWMVLWLCQVQIFKGLYSKTEEETDRVKEQNKNLFGMFELIQVMWIPAKVTEQTEKTCYSLNE